MACHHRCHCPSVRWGGAAAGCSGVDAGFAGAGTTGRLRPGRRRGRTISPSTRDRNGDSRLAGGQAMLREQFGNRTIRRAFLPEFTDDFGWPASGPGTSRDGAGVNSATACRTLAGSNEVAGGSVLNANEGILWAAQWTRPVDEPSAFRSRTICDPFAAAEQFVVADIPASRTELDESRPRPLPDRDCSGPLPVHGHGQLAAATVNMDCLRLRLVCASDCGATAHRPQLIHGHGLALAVAAVRRECAAVARQPRDSFADAESL